MSPKMKAIKDYQDGVFVGEPLDSYTEEEKQEYLDEFYRLTQLEWQRNKEDMRAGV